MKEEVAIIDRYFYHFKEKENDEELGFPRKSL